MLIWWHLHLSHLLSDWKFFHCCCYILRGLVRDSLDVFVHRRCSHCRCDYNFHDFVKLFLFFYHRRVRDLLHVRGFLRRERDWLVQFVVSDDVLLAEDFQRLLRKRTVYLSGYRELAERGRWFISYISDQECWLF